MNMISEKINYRIEKVNTPQGVNSVVLYIDPITSENIYPFKDILTKYKAKWDAVKKRWFWYLSTNPDKREEQMKTLIEPCINILNKKQDGGKSETLATDDIKMVHNLIKQIDEVINSKIEANEHFTQADGEKIKQKIANFKNDLLKATTDEEFRKRFEPVIKQVIAGGRSYSILNTILINIQDPEATYVYAKSNWLKRNRYVFDLKRPIALFVPIQDSKEKNKVINNYLKSIGKTKENQLTPQEENELNELLGLSVKSTGMVLRPHFYDIRFTKVLRGKKDLVQGAVSGEKMINTKNGDENGDLKWFDENTPETEESVKIYDAVVKSIVDTGIKLNFVDKLNGGARGVSKGGVIDVLKNISKNIGACNTLIHEFAHEIFHHKNLSDLNTKEWGNLYIGRSGRQIVEQQAELCAWIVMRFLGYDMKTNINYLGNWGINEENAADVFDQVASASDKIMNLIAKNYKNSLNESMSFGQLTGLDVAKMIGPKVEQLYLKSKQNKEQQMVAEKDEINNLFEKYCGLSIN